MRGMFFMTNFHFPCMERFLTYSFLTCDHGIYLSEDLVHAFEGDALGLREYKIDGNLGQVSTSFQLYYVEARSLQDREC